MRVENHCKFATLVHQLSTRSKLDSSEILGCGPGFNVRLSAPGIKGRSVFIDYRPGIALHVACMEDKSQTTTNPLGRYSSETMKGKKSYEISDKPLLGLHELVAGWVLHATLPGKAIA